MEETPPRLKVVYVVTSTEKDTFLEEAFISMHSLRRVMPHAHIALIVDDHTAATLKGVRERETRYVDELIVHQIKGNYTQKQRSRILKTSARMLLSGDMLFVDTDTLIVRPLDDILQTDADLAGVYDLHARHYKDCSSYARACHWGEILGWPIKDFDQYLNSGVTFARDKEIVHDFYRQWHENLLYSFSKGVNVDQLSYAMANAKFGYIIRPLDDGWNCQLFNGLQYFAKARIIHYFTASKQQPGERPLFALQDIAIHEQVKETGEVPSLVDDIIDDPYLGLAPSINSASNNLNPVEELFQSTDAYRVLRSLYGTRAFNAVERFVRFGCRCKNFFSAYK